MDDNYKYKINKKKEGINMDFFEHFTKNVTQAGQTAMGKAKKVADILKIKEQIRQDKREIKDITYKIGKTYINLHQDDYEQEYEKYFSSLKTVKEALVEKERELQKLNERIQCIECGAEISASDDYCPKCGTPVAFDTKLKEEETIDNAMSGEDMDD